YNTIEYHYDGRKHSQQKTDDEYPDDLKEYVGEIPIRGIIIDPKAASCIAILKKNRFTVIKAKTEVLDGIRNLARLLNEDKIKYNDCCKET
ncbi:PBSX family phage terminase large subunit, partial [Bacillus thuringiensis]|nr:PBSX family phage terminase large subunit [Bacillus thuringiensis]